MSAADRLAEIEARANAATPGPWETSAVLTLSGRRYDSVTGTDVEYDVCEFPRSPSGIEDGEFIAAARQDVPALVAALRAVLTLHAPHTDQWVGSRCSGCSEAYPCQTVLEVEGELS